MPGGAPRGIRPFASGLFQTFCVDLPEETLLAKLVPEAVGEAEAEGLAALARSGARVPRQYGFVKEAGQGILFMELIRPGKMHRDIFLQGLFAPGNSYGYGSDNFIGSLPQKNGLFSRFSDFYWEARLKPQLVRAVDAGLLGGGEIAETEAIHRRLCEQWHLDRLTARLVHGDLWDGNLLFNEAGETVLIDPAVAWSNPEQDLAMLELFGSHASELLDECALNAGCPPGRAERRAFFQVYPLLVHVNLFGASYVRQFRRCLEQYN